MTDPNIPGKDEQAALAKRFADLRCEDASEAPAFPSPQDLQRHSSATLGSKQRKQPQVVMFAAAAMLVAVAVLLFYRSPGDPGAVYSEIMTANVMQTDLLMTVSPEVLPGMSELPGLFDYQPASHDDGAVN